MDESGTPAPRPRARGIYLLPNLFTTGGLFGGFFALDVRNALGDMRSPEPAGKLTDGFHLAAPPGARGDRRRVACGRAGEPSNWGESARAVGPLFRPEPVS